MCPVHADPRILSPSCSKDPRLRPIFELVEQYWEPKRPKSRSSTGLVEDAEEAEGGEQTEWAEMEEEEELQDDEVVEEEEEEEEPEAAAEGGEQSAAAPQEHQRQKEEEQDNNEASDEQIKLWPHSQVP